MYKNFMLLDKSDAVTVDQLLKGNQADSVPNGARRESLTCKSFLSQTTRSGGTANKSSVEKNHQANSNHSPQVNCDFNTNNPQPSSPASAGFDNGNVRFDVNDGCDASMDNNISDDDDPWKKLLNPHEPGDLEVQPVKEPYRKAKRNHHISTPQVSWAFRTMFPPVKYHGPISPKLMESWKMKYQRRMSLDPYYDLYDTVREYTVDLANKLEFGGTLPNPGVLNDDGSENGNPDFDVVPGNDCMDWGERHDNDDSHVEIDEDLRHEFPHSQSSLRDLSFSRMDALLATIAETEWQTGIAARVSKWKQGIGQELEEQESHPDFDIHDYGERILEKLSLEASNSSVIPFSDVVKGQEKYDVARSFSALLQLANNEVVYLERSLVHGESVCCTTENTFLVSLLNHGKKRKGNMDQQSRHQKRIAGPP